MKTRFVLASLALAACDSAGNNSAAAVQAPRSIDAVTAEAVRDTRAAESDAINAADAELDNLNNSIDDGGESADGAVKTGDRVSNTTKVEVY